ncbi:hypothetical protein [Streptomyces sp. NPDC005009]
MGALVSLCANSVQAVEPRQAGMAAAGNNAFRQVGGALGPAVPGTLLTTTATDALPGHLTDAGVADGTAARVVDAVREDGLGAAGPPGLGRAADQVSAAVSEAFLEGLRLCLAVSSTLLVLAAVAAAVLLRRRAGSNPGSEVVTEHPAANPQSAEARSAGHPAEKQTAGQ